MKNITISFLLLLVIVIGFLFCSNRSTREEPKVETIDWVNSRVVGKLVGHDIHVIVIDSCEYIVISGTVRESITHKGNCKFCEERRKK